MGIPYGVPADVGHLLAMVNALPADCNWGAFAISRMQMPWVAQSILLGGNVRVGPRGQSVPAQGRVREQRAAGARTPAPSSRRWVRECSPRCRRGSACNCTLDDP